MQTKTLIDGMKALATDIAAKHGLRLPPDQADLASAIVELDRQICLRESELLASGRAIPPRGNLKESDLVDEWAAKDSHLARLNGTANPTADEQKPSASKAAPLSLSALIAECKASGRHPTQAEIKAIVAPTPRNKR